MKRVLSFMLAYILYISTFTIFADEIIIGPDVSIDDVRYTSSMEVYLPKSVVPEGITEMDRVIRSVGSVDNFITAVDNARITGIYESENQTLSQYLIKTKNFLPKRPLKENPWFTRKPTGKDIETRVDIHINEYDERFITNPMHHTKYKYFNIEAYQDYKDWLVFVNWDGKLGEGYGFAYIDKYGFTHVTEDFRNALVYSADGNLYIYHGKYENGDARDDKGNRYYLKSIPNSVNYGNYDPMYDRIDSKPLELFDESKYTDKVDPDNYIIEWDIADFGYDKNGNKISEPDTYPNRSRDDGIPIVPELNITPSTSSRVETTPKQDTNNKVPERPERTERTERPERTENGTEIVPIN